MISSFLLYLIVTGLLVLSIPFVIRALAERDIIWTIVQEGQTKAVLMNGTFHHFLMSYEGFIFARQNRAEFPAYDDFPRNAKGKVVGEDGRVLRKQPRTYHDWDIVKGAPDEEHTNLHRSKLEARFPSLLENLRWVGIPPFAEVYVYNFRRSVLKDVGKPGEEPTRKPVIEEEERDYVDLRQLEIFTKVEKAETGEGEFVPLNIALLLTALVRNPYKFLFDAENAIILTVEQIESRTRRFVGTQSFIKFLSLGLPDADGDNKMSREEQTTQKFEVLSDANLGYIFDAILDEYGFEIRRVQIPKVDPGSELAKDLIEAATKLFVATQQALADEKRGEGLGKLYEQVRAAGGIEMYVWDQIRESSLTVLSGKEIMPAITVADVGNGTADDKESSS